MDLVRSRMRCQSVFPQSRELPKAAIQRTTPLLRTYQRHFGNPTVLFPLS
jgi:hypothetical protein